MATRTAAAKAVAQISAAIPHLIRWPAGRAWLDYDREADVLYISLRRPQKATDTDYLEKEGILLRYKGKELVGVTVLEASKRGTPKTSAGRRSWRLRTRAGSRVGGSAGVPA